ncbi:MAG: ATP-dependent DNA helicase RecG, partial [Acetobacteraceae bacterium]
MLDESLSPLFAHLTSLRGIGPTLAKLFAKATGGERVIDVLFHLPDSYVDRRIRPTIAQAQPGQTVTLAVEVVRHEAPMRARQPWRVVVRDETGFAELVFFSPTQTARMPAGTRLLVSGKLDRFADRLRMAHPEHVVPEEHAERLPPIEPVWPLTAGLWPRQVAAAMAQALERLTELPEWHDGPLMQREDWPGFGAALRAVQSPAAMPEPSARKRLAYDELLANQVALALVRGR